MIKTEKPRKMAARFARRQWGEGSSDALQGVGGTTPTLPFGDPCL